jgi:hypothetical protein
MVTVTEIQRFKDYGRCVKVSNGVIEALITVDIGPRIISFGYIGSQNFMNSNRKELGVEPVDKPYADFFGEGRHWENLGGHRIWLSPESYPETYTPDDKPSTYEVTPHGAVFTYAPDTEIGAAKTMEIKMDKDDTNMQVTMRIKNISDKNKEFAVWGVTVCAKDGTLIIPMNTNDTYLLPNRIVSVWPYTDMSNDCIYWGNKYVTVKQGKHHADGFKMKLGFDLNCGTTYYVLGDEIFCKRFDTNHPNGKYPDGGCSFETYNCSKMIEIESLSELKTVAPGEENVHTEQWSLCKKPCEVDFRNDDSIDNLLRKI